jgi:hypothetical protein
MCVRESARARERDLVCVFVDDASKEHATMQQPASPERFNTHTHRERERGGGGKGREGENRTHHFEVWREGSGRPKLQPGACRVRQHLDRQERVATILYKGHIEQDLGVWDAQDLRPNPL